MRVGDFAAFLDEGEDARALTAPRRARSTGRPVGAPEWLAALEKRSGKTLAPRKRGPKPRAPDASASGELPIALSP